MAQSQAIHTFILGNKELDGKTVEFQYDRGWYSITDVVGEERTTIYRSKNAQEAYVKWNVYIGRKKERPQRNVTPEDENKSALADTERRVKETADNHEEKKRESKNRQHSDGRNKQERYSNRPNRTRRESVKNLIGEEASDENVYTGRPQTDNRRREYSRRRKKDFKKQES